MFATLVLPFVLAAAVPPDAASPILGEKGQTQLQVGVLSPPLQGKLSQSVLLHALRQRESLQLPASSSLGEPVAHGTRFGASFHMKQQVEGIDVYRAKVIVTVDRSRRVVQLASSVVPYTRAVLQWNLDMDQALERASSQTDWALRTPDGRPYGGVKRMMFPVGDAVHAGYLVWVASADLRHNWYYAVDATSGDILWRQDRVFHANAEADVYASSPGTGGVGVTPTQRVTLTHFGPEHADGGYLNGDQLVVYNCCPNEGCSTAPGAKPKRATGMMQGFPYDLAVCDRVQRATNDVAVNPMGNYVYTPTDTATGQFASQSNPSDSDPFVEVHAFYHVNNVYDFVRGLSQTATPLFPNETIPPFQMRDEKAGKRPAVWTNVVMPDFNEAFQNLFVTGVARANSLTHIDNAAFVAKENFEQFLVPEMALDVDTMMIFQGGTADFGYDAPVLWHEFGHGVIHSTAAFDSFTIDARSGNNEGGALHEGVADFIAAAYGQNPTIGEYVGAKLLQGNPLRSLDNTLKCPEVLYGEVHYDSRHFAAALWELRREIFFGNDQGETFDAAFYAALVAMTPATDFAQAAEIVKNHLVLAFPHVADVAARVQAVFDARGVTNCSKVLDVTANPQPREYYGIGAPEQAGLAAGQTVPGPFQFKLSVPQGAKSVTVRFQEAGQGNPFGGGQSTVQLMAKSGAPITFTRSGNTLTHDAEGSVQVAAPSGTATVQLEVPCGGEVYFTLGSTTGVTLGNVSSSVQKANACADQPDGGADAGNPGPDAGPGADGGMGGPVTLPAIPANGTNAGGEVKPGCGCASVDPSLALFGLVALAGLGRRRHGRRSR